MPDAQKMLLRTSDLSEAVDAVSRVYCPHEIEVRGSSGSDTTTLEVVRGGAQPIVRLMYPSRVRIDAGDFPRLMLMQTCVDGSATVAQGDVRASCRRNQTLPLSPGLHTQMEFDGRFAQTSVRVDIERLDALCARWLSFPLEQPLRFELRPFSPGLEQAWTQAVALLIWYERMDIVLPTAASLAFDEFMLSLVLAKHQHNYSDDLHRASGAAAPRVVREAEHWMREGGAELTVSAIAAKVGVSLRSLEAGFRNWHKSTPGEYLRNIRLRAARAELLAPTQSTTVTSAALGNGFFHLPRFSAYYRAAFNETPGQTLRRSRPRRKGLPIGARI
jgi:AraC-like DNA-binding protein